MENSIHFPLTGWENASDTAQSASGILPAPAKASWRQQFWGYFLVMPLFTVISATKGSNCLPNDKDSFVELK